MKKQKFKAHWWIPSSPDKKVRGTVSFSNKKGVLLKLEGGLHQTDTDLIKFEPIIVGATENGRQLTLDRSGLESIRSRGDQAIKSRYRSVGLFYGVHPDKDGVLAFNQMSLELPYLQEWLNITGNLSKTVPYDDESETSILFVDPAPIEVDVDGAQISIEFRRNPRIGRFQAGVEQHAAILVKTNESLSAEEFINKYAFPLQNFFNLATGLTNFIEDLRFGPKLTHRFLPMISLYYRQASYRRRKENRASPEEMIFSYSQIEKDFESILNRWIRASSELKPVMDLFWEERSAGRLFTHLRLLLIAQALEYYHGKRYSNSKTLRDRLLELISDRQSLMSPLVGDTKKFAIAATNTRNYFTHFNERAKAKAIHDESLIWLTESLAILLQSCLMSEIGIEKPQQVRWFEYSSRYYMLKCNSQTLIDALNKLHRS